MPQEPTHTRPDLADVLAEVNRLRAERGMEPLSEMPKGRRSQCNECPVANALANGHDVRVFPRNDGESGWWYITDEYPDFELPPVLTRFARLFDDGAYPELVA